MADVFAMQLKIRHTDLTPADIVAFYLYFSKKRDYHNDFEIFESV